MERISVCQYYWREQKATLGQINTMLKGFFVLLMTSYYLNCILKLKIIQKRYAISK